MTSPSTIEQTADAVRRALASYPPFRHAAAETAVKTSADRIELYGFVRSEAIANSALALARATAGNVAVTSKLIETTFWRWKHLSAWPPTAARLHFRCVSTPTWDASRLWASYRRRHAKQL